LGGWTFDVAQQRLNWSDIVASLHDEPRGYSPSMEAAWTSSSREHRAAVRRGRRAAAPRQGVPYDMEGEKVTSPDALLGAHDRRSGA
jgi:hypothetical protein